MRIMNVGVRSRGPFMETMPVRPGGQQPYTGVLSREAVAGPVILVPVRVSVLSTSGLRGYWSRMRKLCHRVVIG